MVIMRSQRFLKTLLQLLTLLSSSSLALAGSMGNIGTNGWFPEGLSLKALNLEIQGGWGSVSQGATQIIDISGGIQNQYTAIKNNDQNGIFGLGLYIDSYRSQRFDLLLGVDWFYLSPAQVKGQIAQDLLFPNLAYQYNTTHYPIYFAAKANVKTNSEQYDVTLDVGIGPDIVNISHLNEGSLDNGMTIPDYSYKGNTQTVFTATAGIGIKLNRLVKKFPVELGYRFYYMSSANFAKNSSTVSTLLNTGDCFVNALVFTLTI